MAVAPGGEGLGRLTLPLTLTLTEERVCVQRAEPQPHLAVSLGRPAIFGRHLNLDTWRDIASAVFRCAMLLCAVGTRFNRMFLFSRLSYLVLDSD